VPAGDSVRAVIDINMLVSGLLWTGHMLIGPVRAGELTLVSSPALLAELAEVVTRPKFKDILARSNTNPELMLTQVRLLAEIFDPPPLPEPVSRDPDDDAVLALAAAARPDLIQPATRISSSSVTMPAFPLSARPTPSPGSHPSFDFRAGKPSGGSLIGRDVLTSSAEPMRKPSEPDRNGRWNFLTDS
jgi:uncharacterized protein